MSSSDISLGNSSPVNIPTQSQQGPSFGRTYIPESADSLAISSEGAIKKLKKRSTLETVAAALGIGGAIGGIALAIASRKGGKAAETAIEKAEKEASAKSDIPEISKPVEPETVDTAIGGAIGGAVHLDGRESVHSSHSSAESDVESIFSTNGDNRAPSMHEEIPDVKPKSQTQTVVDSDAVSVRTTGSNRVSETAADLEKAEKAAREAAEKAQKQQAEVARLQKEQAEADAKAAELLQNHENAAAQVAGLQKELAKAKADDAKEEVVKLQKLLDQAEANESKLRQEAGLAAVSSKPAAITPQNSTVHTPTEPTDIDALVAEKVQAALAKHSSAETDLAAKGAASTDTTEKQGWIDWAFGRKPSQAAGSTPTVKPEIQAKPDAVASASTVVSAPLEVKPTVIQPKDTSQDIDFNAEARKLASQKESPITTETEKPGSQKGKISLDKDSSSLTTVKGQGDTNSLLKSIDNAGELKAKLKDHPDQYFYLDGNTAHRIGWNSKKDRLIYNYTPDNQHFEVGAGSKRGVSEGSLTTLSEERVHKLNMKSPHLSTVGRYSPADAKKFLADSGITHIQSAEKMPPKIEKFSNLFHANRKSDVTIHFYNKHTNKMQELTIENTHFKELINIGILPKEVKRSDIKDYAVEGRGGRIWTNSKTNPDFQDRSGISWIDAIFKSDTAKLANYNDAKITEEMLKRGASKAEIDAALREAAIIRKSLNIPTGGIAKPSAATSEYPDQWGALEAEEAKMKANAEAKAKAEAEAAVKAKSTATTAATEAAAKARAKAEEARLRDETVALRKTWRSQNRQTNPIERPSIGRPKQEVDETEAFIQDTLRDIAHNDQKKNRNLSFGSKQPRSEQLESAPATDDDYHQAVNSFGRNDRAKDRKLNSNSKQPRSAQLERNQDDIDTREILKDIAQNDRTKNRKLNFSFKPRSEEVRRTPDDTDTHEILQDIARNDRQAQENAAAKASNETVFPGGKRVRDLELDSLYGEGINPANLDRPANPLATNANPVFEW